MTKLLLVRIAAGKVVKDKEEGGSLELISVEEDR